MTPPDSAPPAGIQDAARHLAEGRAAEAAALLERLVRDFPAYVTAHVLLAKAREASGQPDRALEAWHTAYFMMPGSPLVVRERARLLRADAKPSQTEPAPPHEDEPPLQSEVSAPDEEEQLPYEEEAEPVDPEPAEAAGTDPMAWATDSDAPEATPEPEESDEDEDWAILEETETPRSDADGVTEPVVAPPPGHPARPSAPRTARAEPNAPREADDLDTLIEQLERAPRIRPDPEFRGEEPDPDAFGVGEVVSETLARIYETQKQYAEAARVYEQLADERPARADELRAKAEEMRRRAANAGQG